MYSNICEIIPIIIKRNPTFAFMFFELKPFIVHLIIPIVSKKL